MEVEKYVVIARESTSTFECALNEWYARGYCIVTHSADRDHYVAVMEKRGVD